MKRIVIAVALLAPRLAGACPTLTGTAPISIVGAPPAEDGHLAFWSRGEMYFFTAHGSGAYDPCSDRWRAISSGAPTELLARFHGDPTGVTVHVGDGFAGAFFYGAPGNYSASGSTVVGALYDIARDRWTTLPLTAPNAPEPREHAVIAPVPHGFVVWGGASGDGKPSDTGAVYDTTTGAWHAMARANAPSPRMYPALLHDGARVIVWGGYRSSDTSCRDCPVAPGGAIYDAAANAWTPLDGGPPARLHSAIALAGDTLVLVAPDAQGWTYDLTTRAWKAMTPPPKVDKYDDEYPRLAVEGRRAIVRGRRSAFVYDLDRATWRTVTGAPPPTGIAPPIIGDDAQRLQLAPTPASVSKIDAASASWKTASLGTAVVALGGTTVWTGDRLVFWQGIRDVPDPSRGDGCDGSHRPCDPVVATKQVRTQGGVRAGVTWP